VAVVSAEAAAPPVDAAPLLDAAPSALVADNSVAEGAPVDAPAPAVEANAVVSDGAAAPVPALAADEPAADLPTGPVTPRGPAAPPAAASPAAAPAASTSLALTANLALSPAEADDARRPGEVQPVWTREGDRRVLAVSRTLRSGAIIRFPGDVVVYGDVNAGAHIEAGGNIVVLGSLRGLAHAGAQGDEEAIVLGFDLKPAQLRIADHIAFPLDSAAPRSGGLLALFSRDRLAKGGFSPVVALLREGRIVLEDYRGRLPG
jgi:hypothetical protein